MKHLILALVIAMVGLVGYEAYSSPGNLQEMVLQAKIKFADVLDMDSSEASEELFFLQRDELLDDYERVKEEFAEDKAQVEAEFESKKEEIGDAFMIEEEVQAFHEKIKEYQESFEAEKAEIEGNIADLKERYGRAKSAVDGIQDSVHKIQEGVEGSRDSLKDLKEAVTF